MTAGGRFWATIGTQTVVGKQTKIAAVVFGAKEQARRGYRPSIHKEEGSIPTGVVRLRYEQGVAVASWEPHPYAPSDVVPPWATVALNLINEEQHGTD